MVSFRIFADMKGKWILLMLVLFALTACTADHEAMRQRLKYVSDCNRADTMFTERWLPTVDTLVAYFDRHGSANDRMMAHYVQGRVYHDMGEAPQALECYQKAAEQADTTRSDCDLYTLYAVYGRMAKLFDAQYLPDDEMQALKIAERIAWKDRDTLTALYTYELRKKPYFLRNDTDSVLHIERTARNLYLHIQNDSMAARTSRVPISLLLDRGQYDDAGYLIKYFEGNSNYFDSSNNIRKGYEIYYYDKGRYLLASGKPDSSLLYFTKVLQAGYKEAGYKGLLMYYQKKHIADSIAKYATLFANANDDSYLQVNQQQVEQVRASYNYQKHANEAQRLKEANDRMRLWLLLLALTLVSVLATLLIVFISRRYRKQLRKSNLSKLELLRLSHEQFSAERELQAQSEIRNSAIYETIQRCIREGNDQTLTDEEWDLLSQTVNKAYKNFEDKLLGLVALNEQDYRICLLIKTNVKPIHIAQLTARSPEAISSSRRRLYERVTNTKGKPQDWDAIVHLL